MTSQMAKSKVSCPENEHYSILMMLQMVKHKQSLWWCKVLGPENEHYNILVMLQMVKHKQLLW